MRGRRRWRRRPRIVGAARRRGVRVPGGDGAQGSERAGVRVGRRRARCAAGGAVAAWCAHRAHHAADVAGEHVHAPDFGHRPRGHLSDRFKHQPLAHAVTHLANQDFRQVLAFERAGAFEQIAQRVELAAARAAPLDRGDFGEALLDFDERQGRRGIVQAQPQEHLDRITEIGCRGEDLLALVFAPGHRGDNLPNGTSADLERLFVALRERAPDHKARGDLGLGWIEPGQELACQFRHLQPALGLPQSEADEREIVEPAHAAQNNPARRDNHSSCQMSGEREAARPSGRRCARGWPEMLEAIDKRPRG